jgi:hypothetical protein
MDTIEEFRDEKTRLKATLAQTQTENSQFRDAISQLEIEVGYDLPLKFHPAAIRASAVDTPFGAV